MSYSLWVWCLYFVNLLECVDVLSCKSLSHEVGGTVFNSRATSKETLDALHDAQPPLVRC